MSDNHSAIRNKIKQHLIGAHMSIAGGVSKALEKGIQLGCTTIQIFLRNNNQWEGKAIEQQQISIFKELQRKSGIFPVVGHAIYLVNLASPVVENRNRSMKAMLHDLVCCETLQIPYLVVHAGSHLGSGIDTGIQILSTALNSLVKEITTVQILIEFTSGEGSQIGSTFDELDHIMERTHGKVGICFDTCHVFSAGYQLNSDKGFYRMTKEIERTIGYESIKVIHANDSKRPCGSHVDRHEHIGKGFIGIKGFDLMLNFSRFRTVPFILETPKEINEDGDEMDSINMELLRKLSIGINGIHTKKDKGG